MHFCEFRVILLCKTFRQNFQFSKVASSKMTVEVLFTALDMPVGPICNEDYILAVDGPSLDDPNILFNGCGWKEFSNFTIRSTSRYMTLQFVTDERDKDNKVHFM